MRNVSVAPPTSGCCGAWSETIRGERKENKTVAARGRTAAVASTMSSRRSGAYAAFGEAGVLVNRSGRSAWGPLATLQAQPGYDIGRPRGTMGIGVMLRETLRDFLRVLIFLDFGCAAVVVALGVRSSFFRVGEYLDRRGSLFSLRRPLPSEFSNVYYASYRRSVWLALAFFGLLVLGALLSWLDRLVSGPPN